MTTWQQMWAAFGHWIDRVTTLVVELLERLVARRSVRLVEREPGRLAYDLSESSAGTVVDLTAPPPLGAGRSQFRGCRAFVELDAERILFRPLELPVRATEFIQGVVRSQLDRLMPWPADQAVYGWSEPVAIGQNRIAVTVAAASRASVTPYLQALAAQGARQITVSTRPPSAAAESAPIVLLEHSLSGMLDFQKVRRVILGVLVGVLATSSVAIAASTILSVRLESQYEEGARRINELRARMREGRVTPAVAQDGLVALEARKRESPFAVLALETLSRSLPDHTYVTELRIEGKRVQVIGVTRDAASLIELIEKSSHFTHATFFAPTTRLTTQAGERFHIEAQIDPAFRP